MKIAITGANGQLGTDLCKSLHNADVIPFTHADLDITDAVSVRRVMNENRPDIIINTAAYVRVDDCEDNREHAFQVNALGARNIAVVAQELGAKLVQISTDYVFGGSAVSPLEKSLIPHERSESGGSPSITPPFSKGGLRGISGYTEFDPPSPLNVYGSSKLAGEDFVRHLCTKYFIIRGSGLFGVAGSSGKGGNFVETMLRLGKERNELRVVNDQVFSPTYTRDMAAKIAQLITTTSYGTFHVTNSGSCSWYDFTQEIIKLAGLPLKSLP